VPRGTTADYFGTSGTSKDFMYDSFVVKSRTPIGRLYCPTMNAAFSPIHRCSVGGLTLHS